jgi:hypothetical protein
MRALPASWRKIQLREINPYNTAITPHAMIKPKLTAFILPPDLVIHNRNKANKKGQHKRTTQESKKTKMREKKADITSASLFYPASAAKALSRI